VTRGTAIRRRLVGAALIVLALVAIYTFWLRDSSLFAVEQVEVKGVTANKQEVTAALDRAAEDMTTLHVRDDELRRAVERFPTVASISADASLFHRLEISVTERLPVAEAKINGSAVAVSSDGYVLAGLPFKSGELPPIDAEADSAGRLDDHGTAQAAIVGATPKALRDRVERATWDEEAGGVVVELSGAPELRFGDGDRAEEKWQAVAAVLADPDSAGASYVDVSVPERPVSA
jgi:cell division protein FtsQ